MLKFLRKYQKWMLVVFCAGLMVAFTAMPVMELFMPNAANTVMATTYGENEITREQIRKTIDDLSMLRRLRVDSLFDLLGLPGSLLPNTGQDDEDALTWLMIQHAADKNSLGASDQEAFNLVASLVDAENMEELEEKAKEMNANAAYLMGLGKQYLKAEQYRQLITGIEYTKPAGEENATGSPGLRRVAAVNDATASIIELTQQFQQMGLQPQQAQNFAVQQVLDGQGLLDRISGHPRVTIDELRYTLQQENAEIDLTVVVLDADKRIETTSVSDDEVQAIFERYKADAPGTGEPYGIGYREPNKVKLEALRIPIDQVREKVAAQVTAEDIRTFYDERREELAGPNQLEDGVIAPLQLTAELRDEVRVILTQVRAEQKVLELAQQVRQRLNEDARGLPDDGSFKALPDGFEPTPLVEVAAEIEREHGIMPEVIQVDRWVSSADVFESMRFTSSWLEELPTSTLRMPNPQQGGVLGNREIHEAVLGGEAGLFATLAPEVPLMQLRRFAGLGDLINIAKPFIDPDANEAQLGMQVGLPGRLLVDATSSTYVFRLTDARPARPAQELGPIREQVVEDAKKVKAYESLAAEKDALLKKAADESIVALMQSAEAKKTLTGLQRRNIRQPGMQSIEGLRTTAPIIQQGFAVSDSLHLSGGLDAAKEADRIFAVELAGDYKLALVRLDTLRPMTRKAFQEAAEGGLALMEAGRFDPPADIESPLSMASLMRYTEFKWAEGFGKDDLSGDDEEQLDADADESDEDA